MPVVKSLEDLNLLRDEAFKKRELNRQAIQAEITLSMSSPAIAAGADKTLQAILEFIESHQLKHISVQQTGSFGKDSLEPIVKIRLRDIPTVTYGSITQDRVDELLRRHLLNGEIVKEYVIDS